MDPSADSLRARVVRRWLLGLAIAASACADENLAPNPSFEKGTRFRPKAWSGSFGAQWAEEGHSGRRCLRISRPREEEPQQAWASEVVPVKSSRQWMTLSGWLKTSDVGLMWTKADPTYNASLVATLLDADGNETGGKAQVGEYGNKLAGWVYKETTFALPKEAAGVRLEFRFGRAPVVGTAWLDDVALTYANPPGFSPTLLRLQLTTQRAAMIFYPDDPLDFQLRVEGGPPPAGTTIEYEVRDHSTRLVGKGRARLDPKRPELRLPGRSVYREGVYYELNVRLNKSGHSLATDRLPFGILPKRSHDPTAEPDPFELCGAGHSIPWLEKIWIPVVLERLGVRQCYLIGSDPRDQVLDWCRQARKRYGIEFATNGPIRCTNWGKKDVKRRFFSDEQAFRRSLAEVVSRYKGAVSRVGIMGELAAPTPAPAVAKPRLRKKAKDEPLFWKHSPEANAREQVEVMRIFREEVQKINPSIQVAAGGYFNPEMDLLLDSGLHRHTDVLMVHKFCTPREADRQFRVTRECFIKRVLPLPPLWVDESHCMQTSHEHTASEIVKMHAIYLHYGVAHANWHRFIWPEGTPDAMLWKCPQRRNDLVPRMPYFTYAIMTKHLRGVAPVRKIDLGSGQGVAYLFERAGESVLVAWRWEEGPMLPLRLTVSEGVTAVKVFGLWDEKVELRPLGGQVVVGLTTQPVYVRFDGKPAGVAANAGAVLAASPASISTAAPWNLRARVQNVFSARIEGAARLVLPLGWAATPAELPVRLSRGRATDVEFWVFTGGDYLTGRRYQGRVEILAGDHPAVSVPVFFDLQEPIQLSIRTAKTARGAAAVVSMENSGPATTGRLSVTSHLTSGLRPQTVVRNGVRLADGGIARAVVPLDCPVGRPDMGFIEAQFRTSKGRVSRVSETLSALFCTRATRPHVITGQLEDDDWQTVDPVVLASDMYAKFHEPVHTAKFFYRHWCNEGMWKTPEHWHVKLWTQWDEDHLYLRVKVRETNHLNDFRGRDIWAGDALQINIDADPFVPGRQRHRFNVALTSADGTVVLHRAAPHDQAQPDGLANAAGVVKACVKWHADKHYTVYDLAFPKDKIAPVKLAAGSVVGLTVVNVNRHFSNSVDPPVLRFGTGIYGPVCEPADLRVNLVE